MNRPTETDVVRRLIERGCEYREGVIYAPEDDEWIPGEPVGTTRRWARKSNRWIIKHKLDGERSEYYRARIIWAWHNGAIPEGMTVDHINEDALDDRIENLRLLTREDNARSWALRHPAPPEQMATARAAKAEKGRGVATEKGRDTVSVL